LSEDVTGRDALAQHIHHSLTRAVRVVVAATVSTGGCRRAGQAHAERLSDAGHSVRSEHATARALARSNSAFDAVQIFLTHGAGFAGAHSFEGIDDGELLFSTVFKFHPAGGNRAGVEEDRG